jgi:hypothetical protein
MGMPGRFCSLLRVLQAKKPTPQTSFGNPPIQGRGHLKLFLLIFDKTEKCACGKKFGISTHSATHKWPADHFE